MATVYHCMIHILHSIPVDPRVKIHKEYLQEASRRYTSCSTRSLSALGLVVSKVGKVSSQS